MSSGINWKKYLFTYKFQIKMSANKSFVNNSLDSINSRLKLNHFYFANTF